MAIEFQLRGEFTLDRDLETVLRGILDSAAKDIPLANERIVFALADSDVSITALYTPDKEDRSLLFFRVLDKGRVLEAEEKIVTALDAVLRATEGALSFFFSSEHAILERSNEEVRLIGNERPPREEFWSDAHAGLIHGPVIFVQRTVAT